MATFVEMARRTELFAGIADDALEILARSSEPVSAREGQILFREGEPADRLYVIESGTVRIAKGRGVTATSFARFLATLEPGDVFGEMALVLEAPRSASAVANSPCVLHSLSRSAFDELIARQDRVAFQVLRNLAAMACRRLERTCEGLIDLRQRASATTAVDAGFDSVQSRLFNRA